ncbi:MAG: hypothetical protein M5T61_08620 [Acidimicrobiia bacterium]|nr:hypothetical protein [Acidimicrobiia bacterium]
MRGFRYSRWDGTQVGFDLDAGSLLDEMTDDLLYHGDLNAAMRRMLQQGFRDRDGRQVEGLREMLERLRERRRETLDRYDLGGPFEDIARRLDEIVEQERDGIERRLEDARQAGDRRREELLDGLARERRQQLDELPPDLAGRISELQSYDFMDDGARQAFDDLVGELRKQLLDTMFNQMTQGMSEMTPEQLARMKDMLAELNRMLEQRARGEEPDFEGVHGALRRLLPREPAEPRRVARADGAPDGPDAADAQLDDSRAAGAAPTAHGLPHGRHGPALAGGGALAQSSAGVPRRRLVTGDALPRRRADAVGSDEQRPR